MPSLKPSPSSPRSAEAGTRQLSKASSPSGCGSDRTRGATKRSPGVFAGTRKQAIPRAAQRPVQGGEDAVEVGDSGIRDEALHAVEHVVRPVAARRRRDRPDVRAGLRFGHREAGDGAARGHLRQPALLLFRAAREGDGHRTQRLQREERVGERRSSCERLANETERAQVGLAGDRAAEKPLLPHRLDQAARGGSRRGIVRRRREMQESPLHDLLHPRRELEMVRLEERPHGARSSHRKSGLRFSRKASYASRKFESCMQIDWISTSAASAASRSIAASR